MSAVTRIGVVVFPGSNCDQDMIDALSVYENVEVNKLWHKDRDLKGSHLVILPGGFPSVTICAQVQLPAFHQLWKR